MQHIETYLLKTELKKYRYVLNGAAPLLFCGCLVEIWIYRKKVVILRAVLVVP